MPSKASSEKHSDDITSMNKSTKKDKTLNSSSPTTTTAKSDGTTVTKRKILKRVRKDRDKSNEEEDKKSNKISTAASINSNLGADAFKTLTSSKLYIGLVLLRFLLIFITPASLEGIEFSDGVDVLASSLLPGINLHGMDPLINKPPIGLGDEQGINRTRSIVGAFVSSGIPFMGINVYCTKILGSCNPNYIGYLALLVPRVWMFFISLLTDYFLVKCFAVYEGENALYALITYASTWTTLLGMTRNMNFALEALCVSGLIAACFGWKQNVSRPVFWISAFCLSLGVFLRPPFAFFIFTPIIYLASLIGKSNIHHLKYLRSLIEGIVVFAFWTTIWVTVDSVYFGTFKLRFNGIPVTSFNMFVDNYLAGLPFSYKGELVYTPINALRTIANKKFLSTLTTNTSPGQMFLSLPTILGPLFIVLLRESYEGMKAAVKELMTELKQAANSTSASNKKSKKKKSKKGSGMTKELEDELYVYSDTIQTTFLLGLLIEVVQNHERLGTLSLISLMTPCIICIAGRVFGPNAFPNFKHLHIAFTVAMVILYGFLNQSGIPKFLLKVGTNNNSLNVPIPYNSDLVVYRGIVGHRFLLGPNVHNVSVHNGGNSLLDLMTTLREIKNVDGYNTSNLFVLAAATVNLKDTDFEFLGTAAYGHMSIEDLPNNVDEAVRKSRLQIYRFIGDEDEAIIRDNEEAAEKEEREREERLGKDKKQDLSMEDEL